MRIGETGLIVTLAESPTCSSDAVWISCRPAASCTFAIIVGEVFRYAVFPDIHGLAGQNRSSFLARRRSWVQCCTLRRFVPADGWSEHFCGPGPTCPFDAPRPTRFILFGLTDRLRWRVNFKGRSAEDLVFGVALDFWALTPICDPHPPACGQRTDPALGFASCRVVGHASVQPIGLDPDSAHRPPESHGPRFIAEPRNPYPLMGLKTTARLLPTAY